MITCGRRHRRVWSAVRSALGGVIERAYSRLIAAAVTMRESGEHAGNVPRPVSRGKQI
jgi:hypothetical protein